MKYIISFLFFFIITAGTYAQKTTTKGIFTGSFESNSQYLVKDNNRKISKPEEPFRSNSYLQLHYNYNRWTAGLQAEAYLEKALLNLNPKLKGAGLGTIYINYKTKKIDITAGHFYEQFGSGLVLRSWEDRSLGINNAIMGGRIKYSPVQAVQLTALAGHQRSGMGGNGRPFFSLADGLILGFDAEADIISAGEKQQSNLSLGISFAGRNEDFKRPVTNPKFKKMTLAISGRVNFSKKGFTASAEYAGKSKDAILYDNSRIDTNFVKPGSALLLNFGYNKKGSGFNLSLRRIENMNFLSEREPEVLEGNESSLYYNDKLVNYIPSLTKQHTYNLANIYVYQAQQRVAISFESKTAKAGDIGGMLEFFHLFKKGSKLGGKYGTKVEFTFSNYNNLSGDYTLYPPDYKTDFLGIAQKFFSDMSLEVTKKISPKWYGKFSYINQYYNNKWIKGTYQPLSIKANIVTTEWEHKMNKNVAMKWLAEHMWVNKDRRNWIAGSFEVTLKNKFSFFFSDMFNYGFKDELLQNLNNLIDPDTDPFDIHFYNIGGAYKTGTLRIALNAGRQRGGLVCNGGVCRIMMPSTGFGLTVTKTFTQKQKKN